MRIAYLIAAAILSTIVLLNGPRLPWIEADTVGPIGLFKGFAHGVIGFSYLTTWFLLIGGAYQLILGIIYWDMDTSESERWQFTLESGGTAKLLWLTGAVCMMLGLIYGWYLVRNDNTLWPAGFASSIGAWLACWLFWLAFPLYEQVGIDRDQISI
jgi:hypothetical protein